MAPRVCVVGSVVHGLTFVVDASAPRRAVLGVVDPETPGGKGANQAVAAARGRAGTVARCIPATISRLRPTCAPTPLDWTGPRLRGPAGRRLAWSMPAPRTPLVAPGANASTPPSAVANCDSLLLTQLEIHALAAGAPVGRLSWSALPSRPG